MGGYLAEFNTIEEEKAVDKILPKLIYYWIGLADSGNDNSWMWQESNKAPNYTNWKAKQPDQSTHHCVFKDAATIQWDDHLCTNNYVKRRNTCSTSWVAYEGPIHGLCKLFK